MWKPLLLGVLLCGCNRLATEAPANGAAPAPPAQHALSPAIEASLLMHALEMDRRAEAVDTRADAVESELVTAGVINAEPDARQDYQAYFLPRKPQVVLGAQVFALNREQMETYIGCCVNPGFGLILLGGPTKAIVSFAREHECAVRTFPEFVPDFELNRLLVASGRKGQAVTEVSCRYDDLRDSPGDSP